MSNRKKPTLGQWMSSRRMALSKSRRFIAEKVGVSYAVVRLWEMDSCVPTDDNLKAVCKALGAPIREARAIMA